MNEKEKWNKFKQLKGKRLYGIEGKRFILFHDSEGSLDIKCSEPLIHWRHSDPNKKEEGFWRIEWVELESGDDVLHLHEQETPEPLNYDYAPVDMHTHQKFYVNESAYSPQENIIKNISGYGFTYEGEQFLDFLILELEYEFIYIKSCPVVLDIKISKGFPKLSEHEELLF